MPLHKSGRAHRLDPTMISAPLGDFRHTMHIGRGGDAFGDTSFLSSHGPSKADSYKSVASPVETPIDSKEVTLNHDLESKTPDEQVPQLQHSESVSSFDLDLDLGPSILGDVLGVMDGLSMGSEWTTETEGDEEVFTLNKSSARGEVTSVDMAPKQNDRIENFNRVEEQLNDINGIKSKGLRPKVRFSDKKEEIVGRSFVADGSEEERENGMYTSPAEDVQFRAEGIAKESELPEFTNHCEQHSPSPSSSASSEYEGISPLDRRREEDQLSEESEEEGISAEQGYTFDDESDDEIGL